MVWFRVDDNACFHPKVTAAGNAAMGLWMRAGSWSMQNLTEGHVPTRDALALGTKGEVRRLVEVGLWEEVPGGYLFHQWAERQPTKAQVENERAGYRLRQKRAREKAAQNFSQESHGVSHAASHGPPVPSRPVPTTGRDVDVPPRAVVVELSTHPSRQSEGR